MPIYIQIPNIQGDVDKKEHANWIEAHSLNISTGRSANMHVGKMNDRTTSTPNFSEVSFTKEMDKSSPLLFAQSHADKAIAQIKIDTCATSYDQAPYAQYILSDVLISSYKITHDGNGRPQEQVSLSYSKIEKVFNGFENQGAPVRAGFDLTTAQKL